MLRLSLRRRLTQLCPAIVLFAIAQCASAQNAQQFYSCSLSDGSALPGNPVITGTGLPLDAALMEDSSELDRIYGIRPAFFLMKETTRPNACAVWSVFPQLLQVQGNDPARFPDGTVFLGLDLIVSEFQATGGTGLSIPAILAHEYSHVAQFKYGCQLPSNGKWRELHADYLAGWFTGHRGRFRPQDAYQAMMAFYAKGDYAFNEPGHHGTPAERLLAFRAGFELNTVGNVSSGPAAYNFGLTFLKAMGAPAA